MESNLINVCACFNPIDSNNFSLQNNSIFSAKSVHLKIRIYAIFNGIETTVMQQRPDFNIIIRLQTRYSANNNQVKNLLAMSLYDTKIVKSE